MRKTRLAPKKKITQLFFLDFPPTCFATIFTPFLHTYQLCHLFPAEATYAVLLCRDKRLAFDKVAIDSKVKPISINTEKLKPPKNKRNQIFVGMLIKFGLWETHKIWKNPPDGFVKSPDLLRKHQNHEEDFFKLCVPLIKSERQNDSLFSNWLRALFILLCFKNIMYILSPGRDSIYEVYLK